VHQIGESKMATLSKEETIDALNFLIATFEDINKTLDNLFHKHKAKAEELGYDTSNMKPFGEV
jgi:hypothetical protein